MAGRKRDLRSRWQAAQEAELAFWRQWRSIPTFQNFDHVAYWRDRFNRLGLSAAALQSRTVVEVGCGPLGGIFHLPLGGRKIGLDPLAGQFTVQKGDFALPGENDVFVLRAVGEHLPLHDGCADIAICYNVIDHVMHPEAVLDEILRILRPNGPLYLMAHTFPAPLCPFLGFDKPHPHHWPIKRLLALVRSRGFRVEDHAQEPIGFPITWRTFVDPRAWKHIAADLFVSSSYMTARRQTG